MADEIWRFTDQAGQPCARCKMTVQRGWLKLTKGRDPPVFLCRACHLAPPANAPGATEKPA